MSIVGLVPFGGKAQRWSPLPTPKELLPFGKNQNGDPLVVADHVISAMVLAGATEIVIPVRPEKAEQVMRYFDSRRDVYYRVLFTYVVAHGKSMISDLVLAAPALRDNTVLFGMPDTYFTQTDAFQVLLRQHIKPISKYNPKAHVTLGLWTVDNCEELDVVYPGRSDFHPDSVLVVRPKPHGLAGWNNIWGIAVWSKEFTQRLLDLEVDDLGTLFSLSTVVGVVNYAFLGGTYEDLGRYDRYVDALIKRQEDEQFWAQQQEQVTQA